jgi:hypothetical protein
MPHKSDRTHEVATVATEVIQQKIYLIRGHKVMLDRDLAAVYGVQTFRLNEAVKRNISRFPTDFMFQLTKEESEALISQTAISKTGRGGRRTLPYAFTEQGVAMLATVLNSEQAVQMSIAIIRVFVKLREMIATHKDLRQLRQLQLRNFRNFATSRNFGTSGTSGTSGTERHGTK